MRVDRAPERHLLHHEHDRYVQQQRFDSLVDSLEDGRRRGGGGPVPTADNDQDAEQVSGGRAQSKIEPSLSPELTKGVGGSPGTDDRRQRVEDGVDPPVRLPRQ